MGTEFSFSGYDELLDNLQRLGENASKVENQALKAGAAVLQEAISRRTPRSKFDKEHAADHIAISKIKSMSGIKYVLVGVDKSDNSKWFYLKFIEYGTSRMPAQPFMDPAARESERGIVEAMAEVIKAGIEL